MKIQRKIGWQKYEDVLVSQLESPLIDQILSSVAGHELQEDDFESQELQLQEQTLVPVDEKMMENIYLASNFDCWMGHTNFNITKEVMDKLNKMEGVEILKICSRYRFFMGIGRMFDFNKVRQDIEDIFLKGTQNVEQEPKKISE